MKQINKSAQRKRAVHLPIVTKSDRLNEIFENGLKKQKEVLSSQEKEDNRKIGEITIEHVINLYKHNYDRELDDSLERMVRSPHLNKLKKNMVLSLMPPQPGRISQSEILAKDKVFAVSRDSRKTRRGQFMVSTSDTIQNQNNTKFKHLQLRKNLSILIKKGSLTHKQTQYINTDISTSPCSQVNRSFESPAKRSSMEKLKTKLIELETINTTNQVEDNNPEIIKLISSRSKGKIGSLYHKIQRNNGVRLRIPQSPQKSKRYVEKSMEELCVQDQFMTEEAYDEYFFKINAKILSSRPALPIVSSAIRQYKSKLPLNSQIHRDMEEVTGWGQVETNILRK